MDRRRLVATGIVLLILSGAVLTFTSYRPYEKYSVENETQERVYASCHCFGSLRVLQSYPPQFDCKGINYCRDVNYTRESRLK